MRLFVRISRFGIRKQARSSRGPRSPVSWAWTALGIAIVATAHRLASAVAPYTMPALAILRRVAGGVRHVVLRFVRRQARRLPVDHEHAIGL